ncbi:hypothetical protein MMC21_002179 [Puttea exsequens]|nr:hypothetical protein [Puttea exsequens]
MSPSEGMKPVVLLLGEVVLAQAEWNALGAIAELRPLEKQLNHGTRDHFLADCKTGLYDGVYAISRTYDSTQITGRFDQTLIAALPSSLRFISHNGAGYDSIDAHACAARGIAVSNTPGAVDACSADTAMFLILGALRRIHVPLTALRAGKWRGKMGLTHEPEGKTLGILGMGGIGTAVARRAIGFGLNIQYHNRSCIPEQQNLVNAKYVSFEDLLRTSDIISVHLPLNSSTHGLISHAEFAKMKHGVVLVNTARGPIVNEDALVAALESGQVWGAGLDVHEREPEIHPGLIGNEYCVLLPHVGTSTVETQRKMEVLVVENVRGAVERGMLVTPVYESRMMIRAGAGAGMLTNGTS